MQIRKKIIRGNVKIFAFQGMKYPQRTLSALTDVLRTDVLKNILEIYKENHEFVKPNKGAKIH